MKKKIKTIIGLLIAFIIGVSTTVGAATVFNSKDIKYSSSATTKTNVKDSLDELYSKVGKCPDNNLCYDISNTLASQVEIGNYISMTPISTSYTPPGELTGCTTDVNCTQNTLNPSELNLWRVISLNEDGTIDMVSDKVSSTTVYFQGKTGYISFIKGLNTIAAQYTDGKHIARTRHIGYSDQTETITDTSKLTQTSAPWTQITGSGWTITSSGFTETQEEQGAGDIGYTKDYQLVNAVYGDMIGKNLGGSITEYWLASRLYINRGDPVRFFCGNLAAASGDLTTASLYFFGSNDAFNDRADSRAVRPIATLKSDSEISGGNGSSSSPYTLK